MNSHRQPTADEIACYIMKHEGLNLANLSLEYLADKFELDIDDLREMTLQKDGTSIAKFLNLQKVFLAMKMMEETPEISAHELAVTCGFDDDDTFIKEFRDYFLIDPQRCMHIKANASFFKKYYDEL